MKKDLRAIHKFWLFVLIGTNFFTASCWYLLTHLQYHTTLWSYQSYVYSPLIPSIYENCLPFNLRSMTSQACLADISANQLSPSNTSISLVWISWPGIKARGPNGTWNKYSQCDTYASENDVYSSTSYLSGIMIELSSHWLEQDKSQSHSKSIQSFVHWKVAMTACTCYIAKKSLSSKEIVKIIFNLPNYRGSSYIDSIHNM